MLVRPSTPQTDIPWSNAEMAASAEEAASALGHHRDARRWYLLLHLMNGCSKMSFDTLERTQRSQRFVGDRDLRTT